MFFNMILYCFIWSSNLLRIFSFLFLPTCLLIKSISLFFDTWIFCHLLANLFPSFWLFLVLFWMLWMLVTIHKSCHVPHTSWIVTLGVIFTKILFGVFKEWLRSWSHAFWITNLETLAKKILPAHPEKVARRKKKKKS